MASAALVAQSEPITVLLIGKTGAGKSCMGNMLLGYSGEAFKVSGNAESETSEFKILNGYFCGDKSRPIRIIDSPGLADSKGRDNQFPSKLSAMIEEAGFVHVLLWCRNGQDDRFDENDMKQLAACKHLFGDYLIDNYVMNLSKWAHDASAERKRKKQQKTFEMTRKQIWETVLQIKIPDGKEAFPIFALDAMYDEEDKQAVDKFNEIKEEMWKCFLDLSSKPVFTKAVLEENLEIMRAEEAKTEKQKKEEEEKRINAAVDKERERMKIDMEKEWRKKIAEAHERSQRKRPWWSKEFLSKAGKMVGKLVWEGIKRHPNTASFAGIERLVDLYLETRKK